MPVYFFCGAEDYLLDQKIAQIIATYRQGDNGEEAEITFLDADELNPFQLGEALQFSALFVSRRVVVIKKPYWLKDDAKKVKYAQEIEELLQDYLDSAPPEQVLLLTAGKKSGTNKIAKLLSAHPAVENEEIMPWDTTRVKAWIRDYLADKGQHMQEDALHRIAMSGQGLYYIKNLLDKLALLEVENIDAAFLQEHLDDKTEIKIFKLLDGLLSRNLQETMAAFYHLLHQGEALPYIFFMLFRQFYLYSWVKTLHEQGRPQTEIEKITGQKSFTVKNMLRHTRRFSWPEIESFLGDLLQIDIDMKSTSKDMTMQLECFLIGNHLQ
jgi:DNA polymerase-3 subunit delta